MKFFLDTADINEIINAYSLGLVCGVTTNPSLVAKTGKPYKALIQEICTICKDPISAEVNEGPYELMLKEAMSWAELSTNIVIKVPLTLDGLKLVKKCSENQIATNVTLCFNPLQALLAAKAGATYISPFVGRLDDIGQNGMQCIAEIKTIFSHYNFKTQILVASIRSTEHLRKAALIGADIATIPLTVLKKSLLHPLTDAGLKKFNSDAKKIPSN